MSIFGTVNVTVKAYETLDFEKGRWVLEVPGQTQLLRCVDEDVFDRVGQHFVDRTVVGRFILECAYRARTQADERSFRVDPGPRSLNEGDLVDMTGRFSGLLNIPGGDTISYHAIESTIPVFTDFELNDPRPLLADGEWVRLIGFMAFRPDSLWLASQGFEPKA